MQTEPEEILMALINDLRRKGGHDPDRSGREVLLAHQAFFGHFGSATAQWRERVDGLGCAYERMRELAQKEPGSYL